MNPFVADYLSAEIKSNKLLFTTVDKEEILISLSQNTVEVVNESNIV